MPTAVAPRPSAFSTPVPRRTPPSMSTDAAVHRVHDLGQDTIVGCPLSSA